MKFKAAIRYLKRARCEVVIIWSNLGMSPYSSPPGWPPNVEVIPKPVLMFVEMATTEFATVVVTFIFLPAMVFGIICGVCILKSIIYLCVKLLGKSK